jgi:tetratricopeptide (TPR) repeat protein
MTQSKFIADTAAGTKKREGEALLQAGLAASQQDDSERALHLFARASAADPASAMPHFLIGSEYAARGEMDRAEAALANAVLLAPDLHVARYQLGLLQFGAGRAAVALVSWAPLFAMGEELALARYVRGFASLAQDDFVIAMENFEAGLALNQENPAVAADIRKVLAQMSLGLEHVRMASAKSPGAETAPDPASHVLVSNYGKFGTLH